MLGKYNSIPLVDLLYQILFKYRNLKNINRNSHQIALL
jgi:hypothetical protein